MGLNESGQLGHSSDQSYVPVRQQPALDHGNPPNIRTSTPEQNSCASLLQGSAGACHPVRTRAQSPAIETNSFRCLWLAMT